MSFIEIAAVDLVYASGAGAGRSAETLALSKATPFHCRGHGR